MPHVRHAAMAVTRPPPIPAPGAHRIGDWTLHDGRSAFTSDCDLGPTGHDQILQFSWLRAPSGRTSSSSIPPVAAGVPPIHF